MSKSTSIPPQKPIILLGEAHDDPAAVDILIEAMPALKRLGYTFCLERPVQQNTRTAVTQFKTDYLEKDAHTHNAATLKKYESLNKELFDYLQKIHRASLSFDLGGFEHRNWYPNLIALADDVTKTAIKYAMSPHTLWHVYDMISDVHKVEDDYARSIKLLQLLDCIDHHALPYRNIDCEEEVQDHEARDSFMAQRIAQLDAPCIALIGTAHMGNIRKKLLNTYHYAPNAVLSFVGIGQREGKILNADKDYSVAGISAVFHCANGKKTPLESALSILNRISHYMARDEKVLDGYGDYSKTSNQPAYQLVTLTRAPFMIYDGPGGKRKDAAVDISKKKPDEVLHIQKDLAFNGIPYVFAQNRTFLVVKGIDQEYVQNKIKGAAQHNTGATQSRAAAAI